jgi:AcrR family transcriptional regulator
MSKNLTVASTRDRILKTAGSLFYQHGYRAIGIDRIIAEADVAKGSFYHHFKSKDELMVAWIERADRLGLAWEKAAVDQRVDPLMAVVEAVVARAGEASCKGCTFQVGVAEFAEKDHIVHIAARSVKDRMLKRYAAYARQQGLAQPTVIARQIFLLVEGIWAASRMYGVDAPHKAAISAAKALMAAASKT